MFQELQLSKAEREQRQRSAKLLSTFLWRKVREKLAVEEFYERLVEYEGEPTEETKVRVERQFASIFKIANTIPTHDSKSGRKLPDSERVKMWKNSKLGLMRQIAASDRKGPPPNPRMPSNVTEENMMSVIALMRPGARAKAEMSLGLNTSGDEFKSGLQKVAELCKEHGVAVDDAEGVTSENVINIIERLPEEFRERATQALTTKKLGAASSRVIVREETFKRTLLKPGLVQTKSMTMSSLKSLGSPTLSPKSRSTPRLGSGRSMSTLGEEEGTKLS